MEGTRLYLSGGLMPKNRKKRGYKGTRVGAQPITIRPAYTKKAGKKKGDWYDENATYKPPQGMYRRDEPHRD